MNPGMPHAMNGYHPHNVASTSSNPYPEYAPMPSNQSPYSNNLPIPIQHQHQSRPMRHQHMGQNQWGPSMPPNARQHPQHQQQQQQQQQQHYSQQPWPNTMQHQSFPGGMPGMPGFNMSYLPPQILQDALSMSAPVEAADEMTLVTALLSSRRRGETYKDGLNSLHGKNGHSASLWKDYYLDHKDRLDAWIATCIQKEKSATPSATPMHMSGKEASTGSAQLKDLRKSSVKKPSPASFKIESSPAPSSASAAKGHKQSSKQSTPSVQMPPAATGRRSTINSITAPAPVYGDRLPPPNSEIKIPDPPSRSPSPPTKIIPQGRGNKYTQEDRDFFIKFISWRLKGDPDLSRHDLCTLLAEKAPHHTSQSWASHWSNNHDLPDKILASVRGDEYSDDEEEESSEEEKIPAPRRRPKYRESSTEEEEESEEEEEGEEEDSRQEEEDDDDNSSVKHYEESEMGAKGEAFTEADHYVTANYIASFTNWEEATAKERWEPFSKKHPQRSAKSWAEYYRRNEKVLNKLVRRIQKRKKITGSPQLTAPIRSQWGHPSLIPPKAKRKHELDEDEDVDGIRIKRGREDSGDS